MSMFRLLCGLLTWAMARAISTSWNPSFTPTTILHQGAALNIYESGAAQSLYDVEGSLLLAQQQHQDQCALYKVAMNQRFYFEVRE